MSEQRYVIMVWRLRDNDVVVIPVLNEERTIGTVVGHLLSRGVTYEQLMLVDSGCSDETITVALDVAELHRGQRTMQVIRAREILQRYRHDQIGQCGVSGCVGELAYVGKGAAMYAGALALTEKRHDPEGRIFFFDGDLVNIEEVDPLSCLLKAWERNPEARIAKLSSANRENEGVLAGINALPHPWNHLADLAWPLCGQQSLRLGDLQRMPMPTHYAVEVAILAALVEYYGPGCFTQQPILKHLHEEQHHDDLQRYTRMFTQVILFLQEIVRLGGLMKMSSKDVCHWNHNPARSREIGVPHVEPEGMGKREIILIDGLLPPIRNLV